MGKEVQSTKYTGKKPETHFLTGVAGVEFTELQFSCFICNITDKGHLCLSEGVAVLLLKYMSMVEKCIQKETWLFRERFTCSRWNAYTLINHLNIKVRLCTTPQRSSGNYIH